MFDFSIVKRPSDNDGENESLNAQIEGEGVVYSFCFSTNARLNYTVVSQVVLGERYNIINGAGNVSGYQCGFNFSRNF